MRTAVLAAIIALLALPLMAGTPAAAAPAHEATDFAVEIQEDGNAVWTVSTTYRLENESDRQAFETISADHDSGVDPTPDPALFRAAVDEVATNTDREMSIRDVNTTSEIRSVENGSLGVLKLRFTWTNFAVVTEDRVSVETAFAGGWFGDLAQNQSLVIEPPSGYRPLTVTPSTDIVGGGLQWDGPQSFGEDEPIVVFEAFAATPPGLPQILSPMAAGIGGVILGALLLIGWRRGYYGGVSLSTNGGDENGDSTPPEAPAPPTGPMVSNGSESDGEAPDEEADVELLSDEERVERLLRQNDGRMKQAKIVEETRWSNAKVSQLLSGMADEGRIEKLRIGRENLISLPDEDIEE